jgi:hypothetical protein
MKIWKIVAIATGVLIFAGCGNKVAVNNSESKNKNEVAQTESKTEKSGIINSIKDAMNLGKTMECTYTIKDGMGPGKDIVSKTYIQGKKYKASNEMDGKKTLSLFDENAIYTWTEGEKTGTKMEQKCLDEISAAAPKEEKTGAETPLDDKISEGDAFKDAMDVKCEDASGADFSVPADIIFTDQCEMMKGMMENLKKYQK